jgi:hypothetical protein
MKARIREKNGYLGNDHQFFKEGAMIGRSILAMALAAELSLTSAAIISGRDTLKLNQDIVFPSGSISANYLKAKGIRSDCGNLYPCTLSVKCDLFMAVAACATCLYYCPISVIGSPRPFWVSRAAYTGMMRELALGDAAQFTRVDTAASPYARDNNRCLPHLTVDGIGGPGLNTSRYLVLQNSARQFILVIPVAIYAASCGSLAGGPPGLSCHSYISGFILHWFLQTDGSPQFGNITAAAPATQPMKPHAQPLQPRDCVFTANGRIGLSKESTQPGSRERMRAVLFGRQSSLVNAPPASAKP